MKLLKTILLAMTIFITTGCFHDDHHGHDHEAQEQIIEEIEPEVVTHFSDTMELFVEFDPLISKQDSTFLAHFTTLKDFKPVLKGRSEVCLNYDKGEKECFKIDAPARAGLFKPVVNPSQSGKVKLALNLYTENGQSSHDLGEYTIVSSKSDLPKIAGDEHKEEGIAFLKEQQWKIDFATKTATATKLRSSILTFGRFEFPRNAHQILTAPVSGIVTPAKNLEVGKIVKAGDILAYITPLLGEKEDTATLGFQLQRANANLSLARSQHLRVQKLKSLDAISNKRLLETKNALTIAKAKVRQVKKRLNQLAPSAKSQNGVALRSRIDGKIVSQEIYEGSFVDAGAKLMQIADTNRLWLNIQLSQEDISKVTNPTALTLFASKEDLTLDKKDLKMLYFSELIDPKTATASLLFQVENKNHGFKSGEHFSLRLYGDEEVEHIAIPKSAIVDDSGVKVVYLLLDGEHFERREVETGVVDGSLIGIKSGLEVGDRVVYIGAYRVMLSGLSPAEAGHGHAH